jgi:hypothetical protein
MINGDIESKKPAFYAGFCVASELRRAGIEHVTLGLKALMLGLLIAENGSDGVKKDAILEMFEEFIVWRETRGD